LPSNTTIGLVETAGDSMPRGCEQKTRGSRRKELAPETCGMVAKYGYMFVSISNDAENLPA
jgi:hypothetical protein